MKDRMKRLRKNLDLTQQEFADKIGISRGNIGAYEVGKNAPSDAVISLICTKFNVNEEWLRHGTGEMFIEMTRDEEISAFIGNIQMDGGDSFKKRMVSMLSKLSEDQWELLADMSEKLANENENGETQ